MEMRMTSTASAQHVPDIRELRSVVAGQQTPPSSENFGVAPWSSAPPSSTLVLPSAPTFIISGLHHCDISLSANYDCALSPCKTRHRRVLRQGFCRHSSYALLQSIPLLGCPFVSIFPFTFYASSFTSFFCTCFAPYNIPNHPENAKYTQQLLPGNLRTRLEQLRHPIDPGVYNSINASATTSVKTIHIQSNSRSHCNSLRGMEEISLTKDDVWQADGNYTIKVVKGIVYLKPMTGPEPMQGYRKNQSFYVRLGDRLRSLEDYTISKPKT
ncbi:hypothetical protein PSV09DRAFT_2413167 [Bipolaris maydis]|nr:hypothetical protein J3E74DRAFT_443122 [Bipolaris maydis]KAJ6203704.1 hypothetical protein PSV09DRAFT_2413167 [Bipolaris maydis]